MLNNLDFSTNKSKKHTHTAYRTAEKGHGDNDIEFGDDSRETDGGETIDVIERQHRQNSGEREEALEWQRESGRGEIDQTTKNNNSGGKINVDDEETLERQ